MSHIPERPFVLVDGSSYLFRAFYAPPHLTNSKGEPTGAIYGVINMLKSLVNKYQPSHMAIVFDAKGKTFRNDLYEDYKANRPPMPDELRGQIAPLHAIIKAMGLPLVVIEGVEADDVIGTLAVHAQQSGHHTLISTSDKDMAQLVNEHVTLINTFDNRVSTPKGVEERFGVRPDQIIDYLALMGDSSDNIPGVPGVGEKTAQALLQGMGSIQAIFDEPEKIATLSFRGSKSMAKKIDEHRDLLLLSKQLATIKLDVEIPLQEEDFQVQTPDYDELVELYKECEFRRWLAEALESQQSGGENLDDSRGSSDAGIAEDWQVECLKKYQTITTEAELTNFITDIEQAKQLSIIGEITEGSYISASLVGLAISLKENSGVYIPLPLKQDAQQGLWENNEADVEAEDKEIRALSREQALTLLKPVLEDKVIEKITYDAKQIMHALHNDGIQLQGILNDTMLNSYALNSVISKHELDSLSLQYVGKSLKTYEEIAGKGAKQQKIETLAVPLMTAYSVSKADINLQLHHVLWESIQEHEGLFSILKDIELPLVANLVSMERRGVLIHATMLQKQSREIGQTLDQIEEQAYLIAGESFNLNSPKQLQTILFEKLELPILKKTPKGAPSTAEEVLQELALEYPLPNLILEHRGLAKLKSTYTDKLPRMIHPATSRVHTSFNQAVTATGRLSSTDPNLQNIPIRNEEGRRVRQAFIAPAGFKVVAIDYSQIELRIMAHLSGSKALLDAFAKGRDIHRATASEVFGVELDAVTSEQRRQAKAVNFGLIYGMSAFGLARQLHIPQKEAQKYIDIYFERFPGVQLYMDKTRELAFEKGYVETIFGRRLYLPEIKSKHFQRRKAAERAAINAPMQGSAADVMKLAMLKVQDWIDQQPSQDVYMTMQVHDELVFEVRSSCIETVVPQLCQLMETTAELDVPLLVEAGVGQNWDEAH